LTSRQTACPSSPGSPPLRPKIVEVELSPTLLDLHGGMLDLR
jgi:hypothetical protein